MAKAPAVMQQRAWLKSPLREDRTPGSVGDAGYAAFLPDNE